MSHKKPVPSKETLIEVYNRNKSISKTARHFNTSNPLVRKWLTSYGIEKFSHKEAVLYDFEMKKKEIPSKEDLLFVYENVSISDIRKMYNIGQETFYAWLDYHSIDRKTISEKTTNIKRKNFDDRFSFLSKEKIEEDYSRLMCMGSLADLYSCSMTTIKKLFKLYDIEAKFAKSSIGQNEVASFVRELGFTIEENTRKVIGPLELDVFIPEKNIAIEYCGIYFHSETFGNKSKDYHHIKYDECKKQDIKLITIFDNEWQNKKDIVKSILKAKLGKTDRRIYARNTKFVELSYKDIREFELENHIQGTRPASKYYGLLYNDELVMTISIGKSRYNKNFQYETIRMTTKKNTLVVGGVSKLYKNMNVGSCITYTDNRYGEGKSYLSAGFTLSHISKPNYFYFHKSNTNTLYSRNKFQKHKIPGVDINKSEYQNMLDLGYDRIWDCGNAVYVKT
jgi:transposase